MLQGDVWKLLLLGPSRFSATDRKEQKVFAPPFFKSGHFLNRRSAAERRQEPRMRASAPMEAGQFEFLVRRMDAVVIQPEPGQ
jgi:hypothetical protein